MKKFWYLIIKPIIEITQPKNIVYIGIEDSYLINKIINEYCSKSNAKLKAIDPNPIIASYNPNLEVFWNTSLKSLPQIDKFDIILIDGDPNWYTVYNELKLIEKNILEKESNPIILLHNTYWPYARRDQYNYPENIPIKYRQEYNKQGVFPGIEELIPLGFNYPLNHAVSIGNEKNGVLTAVEDFLKQTSLDFKTSKLDCFQGLSIIMESSNILQYEIDKILSKSGMNISTDSAVTVAQGRRYLSENKCNPK